MYYQSDDIFNEQVIIFTIVTKGNLVHLIAFSERLIAFSQFDYYQAILILFFGSQTIAMSDTFYTSNIFIFSASSQITQSLYSTMPLQRPRQLFKSVFYLINSSIFALAD
ncbi:hypothetical protein FGO68_gene7047 [Halteria grandinella]|uniref:Uncharacterized protein n=1 Tax=Halteria grandinella TaxID=5974 RepID=A0A8J8NNR3_HALGN|nr:hypothetical protein FGO68_gene7047 [Halteria grandinella]